MMKNRSLILPSFLAILCGGIVHAADIYVAPGGSDASPGNRENPLATLEAARQKARANKQEGDKENTIILLNGTYRLATPLVLTTADSGLTLKAAEPRQAVISGAKILNLEWQPSRNGIMQAKVPHETWSGKAPDALMVNGNLKRMARYPNADPQAQILEGTSADTLSPERVARWSHPEGGYLHTMHRSMWGSLHYRITGKADEGKVNMTGGDQNNRGSGIHPQHQFVENIVEELDAPGEWFFDERESVLYYHPEQGEDMARVLVEAISPETLIELKGTQQEPVRDIKLEGLIFTGTARTFMKTNEPLLSSDWRIDRCGALFLQGTDNCTIDGCDFFQLGGNAVFVSDYNRHVMIEKCYLDEIGASGIAFVGNRNAYRGPAGYEDSRTKSWEGMDQTPGPKNDDYPADCTVQDCLITRTGRIEKQSAPVQIAMAQDITVKHCSIYDVPRAGINIGDGCWGGHVIEFCDVFDTVKETSDHGSFNSWGRDRFWGARGLNMNDKSKWEQQKGLPVLDAVKPNIIRNSRWRCNHGWDIDLDDGSSHYEIYNNLMLNRGIKLREGFFRNVHNNITVNSSLHPHAWFATCGDIVKNNIFFVDRYFAAGGKPPKPWGTELDNNFIHIPGMKGTKPATGLQSLSGRDEHSVQGDALFIAPEKGDYRVQQNSPVLKTGFKNFPMDQFGVQEPRLKSMAKTPDMPEINDASENNKPPQH